MSQNSLFSNPKRSRWIKQFAVTVLILGIGFGLITRSQEISFSEVMKHISEFETHHLLWALLAAVVQFLCLGIRLFTMLPHNKTLNFLSILSLNSYGQVMNHWLPARTGDVFKVFALSSLGKSAGLRVSRILATLTVDRIAQLISLLVLLTAFNIKSLRQVSWLNSEKTWWAFGALLVVIIIAHLNRQKLLKPLRNFLISSRNMIFSKAFIGALGISTAAWFFECASLMILANALDIYLSLSQAFFVLLIINLGIAIPLSFANLGTYEAAVVFSLTQLGIALSPALAIGVAHHLVQALAVIVCALMFFTINRLRGWSFRAEIAK